MSSPSLIEEGKREEIVRVRYVEHVEPKIGNSGPVGLCAFALTTFVLSVNSIGSPLLPSSSIVVGLALFYGGMVQILAGMWHLKNGDSFSATVTISFGAFWLSYASSYLFNLTPEDPIEAQHAVGIYLLGWTIFTLLISLASLKSTVALVMLFFCVDMAMIFLTLGKFFQLKDSQPNGLTRVGGVFGILTSMMAWYNAFAGIINLENSYFELPVYELSKK